MRTKSYTQSHMGCLVVKAVCGRYADAYQKEFEFFLKRNGPEWTCDRYKAIWSAALHLKEGRKDLAIQMYQKTSISYNKVTGLPKGPCKPIVAAFLQARQPQKLRKWASVMRIYTGLRLSCPSRKQVHKQLRSVTTPQTANEKRFTSEWISQMYLPFLAKEFLGKEINFNSNKAYFNNLHGMKANFSPHSIRIGGRDTVIYRYTYRINGQVEEDITDKLDPGITSDKSFKLLSKKEYRRMRALKNQPYASAVLSLLCSCWSPPSLDQIIPCSENRALDMKDDSGKMDKTHPGRLSSIQDGGCKGRGIFVGNSWTQMGMAPLHYTLQDFTRRYYSEWSCEAYQINGVNRVLNTLNMGGRAWSIDLSSATDRFPLSIQTATLRMLGLDPYAKALEEIVSQPVEFRVNPWNSKSPDYRDITYSVGQPMGLYGSFPLFHLTHILVIKSLIKKLNEHRREARMVPFKENCFSILGDDVVITNGTVARSYRALLRNMGVEVSELKCFKAPVAEFAGFVVLPTNRGFTAFRPYKYPAFRSDRTVSNPTEFLNAVGVGVRQLRNNRYWEKRLHEFRAALPLLDASLSPIIQLDEQVKNVNASVDMPWVYSLVNQIRSEPNLRDKLPPSRVQSTKDLHINNKPLVLEPGFGIENLRFDPELYASDEPPRHVNAWEFTHQAFQSWKGLQALGAHWSNIRDVPTCENPIDDDTQKDIIIDKPEVQQLPLLKIQPENRKITGTIDRMEERYERYKEMYQVPGMQPPAFSQVVCQRRASKSKTRGLHGAGPNGTAEANPNRKSSARSGRR